jgi:hypothetical protein
MTDAWEERKRAIEIKYFHDLGHELIEKIKTDTREKLIRQIATIAAQNVAIRSN